MALAFANMWAVSLYQLWFTPAATTAAGRTAAEHQPVAWARRTAQAARRRRGGAFT